MFTKPKQFDYLEAICSNYKEELGEESLAQALKLQLNLSHLSLASLWVKVELCKMETEKAECKMTKRNNLAVKPGAPGRNS